MEDPDETGKKEVNDGRLWIGSDYEGKTVEYAIKVIDEDNND